MKQIKDRIARWLYRLIYFTVKIIPTERGCNHLLLIKTDEIGDYILFRNLFYAFKNAEQYSNYRITMVGNKAWKSLYDHFDDGLFDSVLWLDKSRFKKSIMYRFSFLFEVHKLKTSIVVNCIFSRTTLLDDGIAFISKGTEKIAMKSNNTNRRINETNWDAYIYTTVLDAGSERIFDAIRNKNFLEQLLNVSIPLSTHLPGPSQKPPSATKYIALFLGAGNRERKWPVENFVETAKYVQNNYGFVPMLCGGPDDRDDAQVFVEKFGSEAINNAGKTSLVELVDLIRNARLLISVDTGAVHIAAAVNTPVVGLFSGKFFNRFAPYPKVITEHFYPVYPDFVDKLIEEKNEILYDTTLMDNGTIKQIPASKVISLLSNLTLFKK